MPIETTCGNCGRHSRVDEKNSGKNFHCPACGEVVHVPGGEKKAKGRPPKPPSADSYSFVPDIRKVTHTFTLGEKAVEMQTSKGKRVTIPYDDVTTVNVADMMQGTYRCLIKSKRSGSMALGSKTFRGFGDIADQMEDFGPFVVNLFHRLEPHAGIRFTQGNSGLFWSMVVFLVCVPVLIGFAFFAIVYTGRPPTLNLVGLLAGIVALAFAVGVPLVLKGRPKVLRPRNGEYPYDFKAFAR